MSVVPNGGHGLLTKPHLISCGLGHPFDNHTLVRLRTHAQLSLAATLPREDSGWWRSLPTRPGRSLFAVRRSGAEARLAPKANLRRIMLAFAGPGSRLPASRTCTLATFGSAVRGSVSVRELLPCGNDSPCHTVIAF